MLKERKYWVVPEKVIPREQMGLQKFLKGVGYKITKSQKRAFNVSLEKYDLGRVLVDGETFIVHDPATTSRNMLHIENYLDLVDLLEVNEIPYIGCSEKYRKELIKNLKIGLKPTIRRLEQKRYLSTR